MPRPGWDRYALGLAQAASLRSEDPHLQVGAVVLRPDHTVAGVGYNGAPSGVDLGPNVWRDRDLRRQFVIHAEVNALRLATPQDVRGGLLAVTHVTCDRCLPIVAAFGIRHIVYADTLPDLVGRPGPADLMVAAFRLGINMYQPCSAYDDGHEHPWCMSKAGHKPPHINGAGGFFWTPKERTNEG